MRCSSAWTLVTGSATSSAPTRSASAASEWRRTWSRENGSAVLSGRSANSRLGATIVRRTRSPARSRSASASSTAATPPPAMTTWGWAWGKDMVGSGFLEVVDGGGRDDEDGKVGGAQELGRDAAGLGAGGADAARAHGDRVRAVLVGGPDQRRGGRAGDRRGLEVDAL